MIRQTLLVRNKMIRFDINIEGDCPLYHQDVENIDHLFRISDL